MSDMIDSSSKTNELLRFIRDLLNENKKLRLERNYFYQEEIKIINIIIEISDCLDNNQELRAKNIISLLENIKLMVKHLSFDRDCLVQELERALQQIKDLKN